MRKVKLLALAALALFAFGAYGAAGAYATETEEENKPRILCLTGVNCAELKISLKSAAGTKPSLVTLQHLISTTSATVAVEGCTIDEGPTTDINLCKDVKANFTGFKEGESNCRSENAKGEKDPVETVLALLDIHTAAGTDFGVLHPILTMRFLGTALEEEVKLVCGVLKIKVAGTLGCEATPGLTVIATTGTLKVVCKTNDATKDPEIPMCTILCEDVGKIGLAVTFGGGAAEDGWWKITLEGSPSKDIFYDD